MAENYTTRPTAVDEIREHVRNLESGLLSAVVAWQQETGLGVASIRADVIDTTMKAGPPESCVAAIRVEIVTPR